MTVNKKKLPKAIWRPTTTAGEETLAFDTEGPNSAAKRTDSPDLSLPESGSSFERRRAFAVKLVERFALWSGAGALIPVPFIDIAAVSGVQIQMLRRVSQIFGIPFSENAGKSLIASIAGSMIPATSGIGAASILKSVPIFGTVVSGLVMPTLSASATYAIGMTFIEHIVSDGTQREFALQNNQ